MRKCIFSRLVLCEQLPISTSLENASCLSQLLDNVQQTTDMCSIMGSRTIEEDLTQIDNDIFLFLNAYEPEECHIYTSSNDGKRIYFTQ